MIQFAKPKNRTVTSYFWSYCPLHIVSSDPSHIHVPFLWLENGFRDFLEALQKCKGTQHVEHIFFLTELCHLLDILVSAVVGMVQCLQGFYFPMQNDGIFSYLSYEILI